MRKESKAIFIFILVMTAAQVIISYLDFAGVWITDLLGTYLVYTVGGVSYNFAFLVPMALGIIIAACGVMTKTQYVDYILLAVGGALIIAGAASLFPVLIQPHLAT